MGGGFLVVCDAIGRVALAPAEIPVGIVTALPGGPFLVWLLLRRARPSDTVS
jgi:iron complex transport system permease protein